MAFSFPQRLGTFFTAWSGLACAPLAAAPLSFTKDVRPILSKNCFACHGPDEAEMKGDTRLDVPGRADHVEMVARLHSGDPDDVMPPPEANKTVSPEEIAILERWIDEGAVYEKHWAFVPPEKTAVPAGGHPVDTFIDSRLSELGLTRSPEAAPYTRIRRVFLDLTGLPPTAAEADAFAANPTQEAYEKLVDGLLASPRYGERWARRWLDLARYADTNGYEKDRDRSIWPYRDWVVRALNDDMPFDEFTIEQLAGDMLPGAGVPQLVATGFHRNTMLNEEGGIDPLEFRYHAMTDRVATTGTTWLGLTTGCAQCHTHKDDPITHHDYFGMMAYLNNADEPGFIIPAENAGELRQENLAEAARLLHDLPDQWPATDAENGTPPLYESFAKWVTEERQNLVDWHTLTPSTMEANYPYLTLEDDGSVFASGDTSKHDFFTLTFSGSDHPITSVRLEALPDERLPSNGPGMTYYEGPEGDFFLAEFVLTDADGKKIEVSGASETYSKNGFGNSRVAADLATDGDLQSGWSVAGGTGRRHVAVFNLARPVPAGSAFTLRMDFGRHYASSLGRFRLSTTSLARPVEASVVTPEIAGALAADGAIADPVVREAFLMQSPELAGHAAEIRRLRQKEIGTPTLVMRERPPGHTRATFLHNRGEFTQPVEEVPPRLPEAIYPSGKEPPADRLEFARWIVSPENPLTARVVANRHWAAFFGTGLVSTLDDFGMQGELPSHPELLDYLAVDFMENGWSLKNLHRLIVTSATYQQSSVIPDQKTLSRDVRLLRLFPRSRLEAEIIRDASLAASGLLHNEMFGPPVRPPQPASAQAANFQRSKWEASQGSDRFRRSIYTYQKRTAPFAMFTTFDATSGEACVAQRDVSNTPLQALTLMNDPMFIEIAEAYGKRTASVEGGFAEKATAAFRWLLTRPPTEDELALLAEFHRKHDSWSLLARALLSLDEAITKN